MLKEGDIVQVIKREDAYWNDKIPDVEDYFFDQKYIIFKAYHEDNEFYIKRLNSSITKTHWLFEGRNLKKIKTIRKIV
jgi:hypothetical protein